MFKRSTLFFGGFGLILLLWALHLSALFFYLYWSYWWFDIVMHFTTGLAGGLIVYWVISEFNSKYFPAEPRAAYYFVTVVVCVLILAMFWEALEFLTDQTQSHEGYLLDSLIDTTVALIGSCIAVFIGVKKTLPAIPQNHA